MATRQKLNEGGFHVIALVIALAVIGVIGFAGFRILHNGGSRHGYAWDFVDNKEWKAIGSVPACPSQVLSVSPADTSLVTEILWPGQYRGTDYKPHGGFRYAGDYTGDTVVKLPFDAHLVGAARYEQRGDSGAQDTQYTMTFENDCGYQVMYDHLYAVESEFKTLMDQAPSELDNTEGRLLTKAEKKFYKAGTVIATRVGFPKDNNIFFDFGVYDLRQPNEISKNAAWAAVHTMFPAQESYGVCWIDLLPSADKERITKLLPATANAANASDYCTYAPGGTTLKYNDGKPPETANTNTQNTQSTQ